MQSKWYPTGTESLWVNSPRFAAYTNPVIPERSYRESRKSSQAVDRRSVMRKLDESGFISRLYSAYGVK
jgi:hypothetical protein